LVSKAINIPMVNDVIVVTVCIILPYWCSIVAIITQRPLAEISNF
jgi:hypothetical protein